LIYLSGEDGIGPSPDRLSLYILFSLKNISIRHYPGIYTLVLMLFIASFQDMAPPERNDSANLAS
jgi:hypothetical protein